MIYPRIHHIVFILSAAAWALTPLLHADAPVAAAPAASFPVPLPVKLPAHPRLFANAADWERIRGSVATDPVSRQLFAMIRDEADMLPGAPPVSLVKQGRRLLGPVRNSQARILRLALTRRLTGDTRYFQAALVEIRNLASAPDWNPSHFLDVAEAALALAVAYDWLYDDLADSDRRLIEEALLAKALQPSFASDYGWWIAAKTNWNQVCHGGLTAAALAIAECDRDLARRTIDRARAKLPLAAEAYAPDGAYAEGPIYWEYGTMFHILLVEALRTSLGTDGDLDAFPGFLASADYMRQVTSPSGAYFNYGDSRMKRGFCPPLFWFARRQGRPGLSAHDLDLLRNPQPDSIRGEAHRFMPFALLWHGTAPVSAKSMDAAPRNWFGRGLNPVGIHRSAWGDSRATYLAIKGGSPSNNHAHMDAGSFILEADGVRWAVDTGMQDYHSLESKGLKLWARDPAAGDRWRIFRLGPESHNIPRVNHAPPRWDAAAKPLHFQGDGPVSFTQFDLTPLYAGQVMKYHRGAALHPGHVIIQDEWTAPPGPPATITFQWLTHAAVTVDETTGALVLRQSGETLCLRVSSTPAAGTGALKITVEDAATLLADYDAPNPGLKRILIQMETGGGADGCMAIEAYPGLSSTTRVAPSPLRPLAAW